MSRERDNYAEGLIGIISAIHSVAENGIQGTHRLAELLSVEERVQLRDAFKVVQDSLNTIERLAARVRTLER